jgi:MFS family permease
MINRIKTLYQTFPRQYWILLAGILISRIGMGMIWPFLTVYLRQKLDLPLSTITSLLTIDTIMSILSSFIAGAIADRFGRKWVMVISMGSMGIIYTLMSQAGTLPAFALLMAFRGLVIPLYRVGADAMVVDLIPREKRPDAYALLRMMENLGVAIGPAIGGFLAAVSYTGAFLGASASLIFFSMLIAVATRETLPTGDVDRSSRPMGYSKVLKDRFFLVFVAGFTTIGMASSVVFALISVYIKENFGLPETQAGFLITINAMMVVLFQVAITRYTRRKPPLAVMAVGAFFYSIGVGGMALGSAFPFFALCMAIMTIGELLVAPTANSVDARALYEHLWIELGVLPWFGPCCRWPV